MFIPMKDKVNDSFLTERIQYYDQWLAQGKISYSSKVVPIKRALEACQYVLPTEQVSELMKKAKSIAITDCECRRHYQWCDNPLEICFLLNDFEDNPGERHLTIAGLRHGCGYYF